jgi:hypothetical protein
MHSVRSNPRYVPVTYVVLAVSRDNTFRVTSYAYPATTLSPDHFDLERSWAIEIGDGVECCRIASAVYSCLGMDLNTHIPYRHYEVALGTLYNTCIERGYRVRRFLDLFAPADNLPTFTGRSRFDLILGMPL